MILRRGWHQGRGLGGTRRRLACLALALLVPLAMFVTDAMAAPGAEGTAGTKVVGYHGYRIVVPAQWPVYHLTPHSTVCVRFDRHALYLGSPGAGERCRADAVGRTEAILVTPLSGRVRREAGSALAQAAVAGAQGTRRSEAQFAVIDRGVEVTATWNRDRGIVERALGVKLSGARAASMTFPRPQARPSTSRPQSRAGAAPHASGTVYTGLGFDACTTPGTTQMTAWGSSPYRAIGIYIGGENAACAPGTPADPYLNASWVAQESAAGWHLIPTYVGAQAPSNSCGCASIIPSQATSQGTAAATDAVTQAQALGIGAGNPIYFDMEGYNRTSTNTQAVLAFLSAWTTQLHADGYLSGVYSSADSGIADLAAQAGTTYPEPDDIWFARWGSPPTTSDPSVPSADWAGHQRLHQYKGAHNETYSGVTINIDNDYLDGATAFGSGPPAPPATPSLRVSPASDGTVNLYAGWQGVSGVSSWLALGGSTPTALATIGQNPNRGAVTTIPAHSAFPYYAVEALDANDAVLGTSPAVATGPHLALYGHSAFVPARGLVGVPAGCFTGTTCDVALTIFVGHFRIARSGPERLATSGGILYFKLSRSDRVLLAGARGHRLAVKIVARDVSGTTASTNMSLIPFTTTGPVPGTSSAPANALGLIGLRDFVYRHAVGGILAGCVGASPCLVTTKITLGHRNIASTGVEFIGANEAGYLSFKLRRFARALLGNAPGNQLAARVTISDGTATAHGSIALSSFS